MLRSNDLELACHDLDESLAAFTQLGFRLVMIYPADEPAVAVIRKGALQIRLVRGALGAPAPTFELPALASTLVITRNDDAAWRAGRAGMMYRDLIPDRQGGRFIASHIKIRDGGPVPDYVHYHAIRFQLIYCHAGWVRLVYEDQGEPFVMRAGDCVVQPPEIRHRVLESSQGLEVIEVGCPAVHPTYVDHELALPNAPRDRSYGGQHFTWHRAAEARWEDGVRDLGVSRATEQLASARVLRRGRAGLHGGELELGVILQGHAELSCEGAHALGTGDAFVVPRGSQFELTGSEDLEWLEVTVADAQP